jgi:hypothetical protein
VICQFGQIAREHRLLGAAHEPVRARESAKTVVLLIPTPPRGTKTRSETSVSLRVWQSTQQATSSELR